MKNCPNCGAPIEPYKCKCEYCGTYYYDLSSINLSEGKPCYIQFKANNMIFTALANPSWGSIEITSEPFSISNNRECNISLHFQCLAITNNETLFQITKEEK